MFKITLFVLSLILSAISSKATQCELVMEGYVLDKHDFKPLVNAVIKITGTTEYKITDDKGYFKFSDLCEDEYTIEVSHFKCETQVQTIHLDSSKKLNIKLEHHIEELNEVLVSGNLYNKNLKSTISSELNQDQIDQYSNASLGDAISELNGVTSLNTGNSIVKPVIEGLHSSRVLLINNNVRMEDQQWGVDHSPSIDLNSAANINVIKGASALEYGGDAIGGVIIAKSKKAPIKDTLTGKTIVNAVSNGRGGSVTSQLLKATDKGFHIKAQGSLKFIGDRETPDYILSNTGQREQNFSLSTGLNKIDQGFDIYYSYFDTEIGILRASHIGNVADLVEAINNQEPNFTDDFTYDIDSPSQDVVHHLFKFESFKKLDQYKKLKFQYDFQKNRRKEFDIRRGGRSAIPALDLKLKTHTIKLGLDDNKNGDLKKVGAELSYQDNYANPDTGVRRLIPDYEMYRLGIFSTAEISLNDKWVINGGLRYDFMRIDADKFYLKSRWEERNYEDDFADLIVKEFPSQFLTNPVFDYHNFSAAIGTYFKTDHLVWRVNLNAASRAPNPSELFSDGLHHSIAQIELGDLRIESEKSFKAASQLIFNWENLTTDFSAFYKRINDFILLEPDGIQQTIRGAFPVFAYSQTDVNMAGIDLSLQYQFDQNWNLKSDYSYTYGQDIKNDRPVINMPPPSFKNQINYAFPEWNQVTLSLTHRYVFEQNRFPDDDFTTQILNSQTGEFEQTTVNISQPPNAYNLIDFRFNYPLEFDFADLNLALSINNLLNTSYRSYLNRQRFYADEIGRNFLIQLKLNY